MENKKTLFGIEKTSKPIRHKETNCFSLLHTLPIYTLISECVYKLACVCPRWSSMKKKNGIRYFSHFRIGFGNLKNGKVKKLCSVITEAVMVKCSYMSRLEQVEVDCAAYCATWFISWFMMCRNDLPPLNFLRKSVSTLFTKY